jgi:magnesium chelatase accessory protein
MTASAAGSDWAPDWAAAGADWPNRAASRFVRAAGFDWHVQVAGDGPTLLLAHGTGAATHSWRDLLPLLASRFTVVAPDLPGHGFTGLPPSRRLTLPGMAWGLRELLRVLGAAPALAVGHSAGAAILVRMALDGHLPVRAIVSLNGALLPLGGMPGPIFSPLARMLVVLPGVPRLLSWQAGDRETVARLLAGTGSAIDDRGVGFYARLLRHPRHVQAALGMMANWDLDPLAAGMARLTVPLVLVAGGRDRTIPPSHAERVRALLPAARIVVLQGLGHLAHEERPDEVAQLIATLPELADLREIATVAGLQPSD